MSLCTNCMKPGCDGRECESNHHLFVYGTLKKGNGNHRLLERAQFLGNAISADKHYLLHGLALLEFPGAKRDFLAPIKGELYIVPTASEWQRLDRLEGHPRVWRRMIRPFVTEAGREFDAWVYIYQAKVHLQDFAFDLPRNADGQYEFAPRF